MVSPALILPPEPDERWELAAQMGVTDAVVHPLEIGDGTRFWEYERLQRIANWLEDVGIDLSVVEGSVPLTDTTKLGLEGRDEEIEAFKQFLRDCGDLAIPVVAYDWGAGARWSRTSAYVESRGGSWVTAYDDEKDGDRPFEGAEDVTAADLRANLAYFLDEVVPVAEEAGVKLALHPDDPPRTEVRGMPRIANSVEAFERVLALADSDHHGITFCQGNFTAMGADVPATIRRFGDRIHFVHFRDVAGDADSFVETWHDDGPTDMAAAMAAYRDVGFEGPMRPDHVPTMTGESNETPGYHTKGRLFAIGYIRGILDTLESRER